MPPLRVWRVWGLVALSAAVGGAIVVAFFALLAVSAVVTALKGQWPLFVVGFLVGGIVWFIAASRLGLGAPGSGDELVRWRTNGVPKT